jgi:peptidyl-prolyl cis-trans isomerase D
MSDDQDLSAKAKRRRRSSQFFGWILVIVLLGGLGGFGVTNFGSADPTVGSVGDQKITARDYARALSEELDRLEERFGMRLPLSQAAPLGVAESAMQGLVWRTAMDGEMARVGLSVGDAVVADQIASISGFQMTPGVFDPVTYRETLARNNLTEAEFESGLRKDSARQILTAVVVSGFQAPEALTRAIHAWSAETRDFSLLSITEADLPAPLPAPDEAALIAHHAANIDTYSRGEARRIRYAALLPDALAPSMPVDESEVRALYDARLDEFVIPEKRLVERLVYPDQAAAEAALAELAAGKSFDDLVAARNLTLEDVDMGDVGREDLGTAADAVFALAGAGEVSGVVQSDLGPALFRLNAVLAAQETPFEEVRDALALEVQTQAARSAISDRVEALEDLLAGGASLDDLAGEAGMILASTDYVQGGDNTDDITAYGDFRTAADALAVGDFPEWIGLEDGGIVAMQLVEILPPAPLPLDEVRERVAEDWRAAELSKALAALAATHKDAVDGGASLSSLGIVSVKVGAGRDARLEDTPTGVVGAAFGMQIGETRVITEGPLVALMRLDGITPAAAEGETAATQQADIGAALSRALASDALGLFQQSLVNREGLQLDPAVVNAVQASFN